MIHSIEFDSRKKDAKIHDDDLPNQGPLCQQQAPDLQQPFCAMTFLQSRTPPICKPFCAMNPYQNRMSSSFVPSVAHDRFIAKWLIS
jgi:hypothetical protein